MIRVTTSAFRYQCSDLINQVVHGGERVVLRRHGKDVAVVISAEDFCLLEKYKETRSCEQSDFPKVP